MTRDGRFNKNIYKVFFERYDIQRRNYRRDQILHLSLQSGEGWFVTYIALHFSRVVFVMKQRLTKPLVKKKKVVHIVPRTWFGHLVAPIAATTLLLLAVLFFTFFFTIFIALLGVLSMILIARTLWAVFKSKGKPSIDIKYSFEKEEGRPQNNSKNQLPDER